LPHINSSDGGHARAAAERQAVNSTVQGSAADLVKKAMIDIERRLAEVFPASKNPIRFRKSNALSEPYCKEGAFMLLQLHDELLYEVRIVLNFLYFWQTVSIFVKVDYHRMKSILQYRICNNTFFAWASAENFSGGG
jgi:hypothetical protein